MGRPTNEERAKRAAAAIGVVDPPIEAKVEQVPVQVVVQPDVAPLTLVVPAESYSPASAVFRRQLDGWLDEAQRQGMHRGESLVLVAPKE
jgi:hypothetical protein